MTRAVLLLSLAILGAAVVGLASGDLPLSWREVWLALSGGDVSQPVSFVVWSIRLPRLLQALLVGVALAVAGVIAQAVLRNPLADPGLLGINAGAGLAAMIVLVIFNAISPLVLPAAASFGAALMVVAIFALSWRGGTSSIRIVLIGIGLSALAGGATTFLSATGDIGDVQRAMIWMVGSVYDSNWTKVIILLLWVAPTTAFVWLCAHHLDVIGLGDGSARSLGQRVDVARALMMLGCTLLSGAAVATAGLVGFVGLVAPHVGRRLVGSMHARLVPVSALAGGGLVAWADLAGRAAFAPTQLPVGLTIALLGAPFFAFLMWERRHV